LSVNSPELIFGLGLELGLGLGLGIELGLYGWICVRDG